ncbi:SDR family oxidoreductase [Azospirillum sp. RWY-5-1]|uniref:SDR family oxidoreductase n=1 Tax=Azospirillum oleiclasticum TaxID=2735135 RepID=A0ABX2T965_9PROT|nr:SDR family oxidoreductase [Azospirillum oleiclasticum]NYZ12588.1 SDR family oxidoreductase [Azospirillum oleiclasticum]NYZ19748.1 SDR family oxidoreductase [Azospirillum oleiclasticum]
MRVFVTGATGWVGSAIVADLLAAGHHVTGLSRSAEKAFALEVLGAHALLGTLADLDRLARAADEADAVIHTAFDFANFPAGAAEDRQAIEAMGAALRGSDRPMLVTSGLAKLAPGRLATEDDAPDAAFARQSEAAAQAVRDRGGCIATVRLAPSVHGVGETHGFVPHLIRLAQRTGVSAFLGDGANRWASVHRQDAARLYRLALEQGVTETAYHAAADEGVPFRDIAAVIGGVLGVPVEPRGREHFGWFADFAGGDMAATSERTRRLTGWKPTGPGLLAEIAQAGYYAPVVGAGAGLPA